MEESQFSRNMYLSTAQFKDLCWICALPLGNMHTPLDLRPSKDHVIPRVRGGKSSPGNIRMAHRVCNTKRGCKDVDYKLVCRCQQSVTALWGSVMKATRSGGFHAAKLLKGINVEV